MQSSFRWIGLLALASVGCGSSHVSERGVVDARATTRAAAEVGAEQTPQASYYLELANEELASGSALANDSEGEAGDRMFQRAGVDAELAIALSNEAQTVASANETQQRIDLARQTYVLGEAR